MKNSSPTDTWLFIDTGSGTGQFNMAFDRMMMETADLGSCSGIFRLYSWAPAAISVGRFQDTDMFLNTGGCAKYRVDTVRRMTGGGAILHDDEITYSLICRTDMFSGVPVKESYRRLTGFLMNTYSDMGFDPVYACDIHGNTELGLKSDFCYAQNESYDIMIAGRKIGGNAQKRTKTRIFQHGSIPVSIDRKRLAGYFKNGVVVDNCNYTSLSENGYKGNAEELKIILRKNLEKSLCIKTLDFNGSYMTRQVAYTTARQNGGSSVN